jgi:hypothetical protein
VMIGGRVLYNKKYKRRIMYGGGFGNIIYF